jgi:phenylacetate-CoA ligase
MPLIRYRVGDRAVAELATVCDCGRAMPRVRCVTGRTDDILYVEERGYVGRLDPCFKGLSDIVEAQIIQEELARVRVLVVPADGYGPDVGNRLVSNLRDKLGTRISIRLDLVPSIPRGANGKFRSVVSRVKHLYPDRMETDNRV